MKETMQTHVGSARRFMFGAANEKIKNDLGALCHEIEAAMTLHIDNVMEKLKRDYIAVLVGCSPQDDGSERILRSKMRQILSEGDLHFAELLGRGE